MRQIVYVSTSTAPGNQADIDSIMLRTRHNNALDGLTGLLWVHGSRYLQVIEGDADAVVPTMKRIGSDARHCDLHTMIDRPIAHREFQSWTILFRHAMESDGEFNDRVRHAIASKSEQVKACFVELLNARACSSGERVSA